MSTLTNGPPCDRCPPARAGTGTATTARIASARISLRAIRHPLAPTLTFNPSDGPTGRFMRRLQTRIGSLPGDGDTPSGGWPGAGADRAPSRLFYAVIAELSRPSSPCLGPSPCLRRAHRSSAWWAWWLPLPLSRGRRPPCQRSLPEQKFDRVPVEQHERLSFVPVEAVLHQGVAHRFGWRRLVAKRIKDEIVEPLPVERLRVQPVEIG